MAAWLGGGLREVAVAGGFVRRPVLGFRVGVTGMLAIPGVVEGEVRARVGAVLGFVAARVVELAAEPLVAAVYDGVAPILRVISPLAEGADRLVAAEGLARGFGLMAPLPFARDEYERGFPDSVAAFRELLAQAGDGVVELDGARGLLETRSYEAVGRFVVRNCDLLIAIWDGRPGKGPGGTADIVRYAARHGQPIWWINPLPEAGVEELPPPAFVRSTRELNIAQARLSGAAASAALRAHIEALVRPPPALPRRSGMIGGWLHRRDFDPVGRLFAERRRRDRVIWRSYRWLIRTMAGRIERPAPAPAPAPVAGEIWDYWRGFYQPTDELAVDYANRYRSCYVLVFGLAALAVCCAVTALALHPLVLVAGFLEFLCLGAISALVAFNIRRGWHSRLIGYRLMAELFRKQQALGLLGWSLPAADPQPEVARIDQVLAIRESWVGWYFNAAMRAAPLPRGVLGGPALIAAASAVRAALVAGQSDYHAVRRRESRAATDRLGRLGLNLFFATFLLVGVKLLLVAGVQPHAGLAARMHASFGAEAAGMAAAILPALSACFVGIRGYAELELLADQSAQMEVWIETAAGRLDGLDLAAPLASQDFGAEILDLAQRMLLDIQGWAQLFRLKAVEPG